ncbi:hypothetical protein BT96DRAFT_927061 [Gymnopus androsaceus JB14]|uniref:Uncharacterized protein n=1 Tax=Gymnopus androsaceus JB14 TaxID=1447944 RepID=A0A6A4GRS8_9AGAR|nr:hypothetical protein BT96DRAFT_927061 [Gymnopus androsaceus JB14]
MSTPTFTPSADMDTAAGIRPTHHVHSSNDPLPGAKKGVNAVDYSTETMERTPSTWNERTEEQFARDQPEWDSEIRLGSEQNQKQERHHEEQPNVVGGDLPGPGIASEESKSGKASMMDKVVGKTQKVIGKATHKPEMQEKGEVRATAGKA